MSGSDTNHCQEREVHPWLSTELGEYGPGLDLGKMRQREHQQQYPETKDIENHELGLI